METSENKKIRLFIGKHFNDSELETFCFDYFPDVRSNFTGNLRKSDKIIDLIDFCQNRQLMTNLLANLQKERQIPYQQVFNLQDLLFTPPIAKPRNPKQVFISYSTKDATPLAKLLAKDLRANGYPVWIAPESIMPGEKWGKAIERGLQESGIFILLMTPEATSSFWVEKEMEVAMGLQSQGQMRIFPLDVKSCTLPLFWKAYQFIPFRDKYADGWNHLWQVLEEGTPIKSQPKQNAIPPPSQSHVTAANSFPPIEKSRENIQEIPIWVKWGGLVLALLIIISGGYMIFIGRGNNSDGSPTTLNVIEPAVQAITENTRTPTKTPTNTPIPTTTPTSPPTLGDVRGRPADGATMLYVPSGTFAMGSNDGTSDEQPIHDVTLDNFWIDQTEVTNGQFSQFIIDTNYETTAEKEGSGFIYMEDIGWKDTKGANWQHPTGANSSLNGLIEHPVVLVSWEDANAYCNWADGRLPTEAEWEYAARSSNGNIYPWGNNPPTCTLLNFHNDTDYCVGSTTGVGSYSSEGDSWVGASDMAGNVWEWVNDWYNADYYANSPVNNPTGLSNRSLRVLRGGSWFSKSDLIRSSYREASDPLYKNHTIGFRCVSSGT